MVSLKTCSFSSLVQTQAVRGSELLIMQTLVGYNSLSKMYSINDVGITNAANDGWPDWAEGPLCKFKSLINHCW